MRKERFFQLLESTMGDVRPLINEDIIQNSRSLETLLKNAGFQNGIRGLENDKNPLVGQILNYIRKKNIAETNVYQSPSGGGRAIIIIEGDNVLYNVPVINTQFKYGRIPMSNNKVQVGTYMKTIQGTGGPKETESPFYMNSTVKDVFRTQFEKATVDPKTLEMYNVIPLMDEALKKKGFVKGLDSLTPGARYKVQDKTIGIDPNKIYSVIEGEKTPIVILQKVDDMKYKVIKDNYKIYEKSRNYEGTIDVLTLYNLLK